MKKRSWNPAPHLIIFGILSLLGVIKAWNEETVPNPWLWVGVILLVIVVASKLKIGTLGINGEPIQRPTEINKTVLRNYQPGNSQTRDRQTTPKSVVEARYLLYQPDQTLEAMIEDRDFREAKVYIREMEMVAKEMKDEAALRRYKIYEKIVEQTWASSSDYDPEMLIQPERSTPPSPTRVYDRSPEDTVPAAHAPAKASTSSKESVKQLPPLPRLEETRFDKDKPIDPDDYGELISL